MPRFLHAADIHLDSPLRSLRGYDQAPADAIADASRDALERMATLAIEQRVDAVLIAGDLYDGRWTEQRTGLHFVGVASRLVGAGIPVLVIRGNHDAENVMTSSLPLPKNPDGGDILIAADRVESRAIESAGLMVHARSFATRAVKENLAVDYPAPATGYCNIGMLHTSLTGAEGHDTYSPCSPEYLTDKGYDYWALGHVHRRRNHGVDGGPPIMFPGNLQGRHVGETGAKGCLIVDVDDSLRCKPTFHSLADVRWHVVEIDASDLSHVDDVTDVYRDELSTLTGDGGVRLWITRVVVRGETDLDARLRRDDDRLSASLQAVAVAAGGGRVWMEKLRVRTSPPGDRGEAEVDGPLASLNAAIESAAADDDFRAAVAAAIAPVRKKVPGDVDVVSVDREGDGDDGDDPLSELVADAAADLTVRLVGGGAEDGS